MVYALQHISVVDTLPSDVLSTGGQDDIHRLDLHIHTIQHIKLASNYACDSSKMSFSVRCGFTCSSGSSNVAENQLPSLVDIHGDHVYDNEVQLYSLF